MQQTIFKISQGQKPELNQEKMFCQESPTLTRIAFTKAKR
jgi:hypothetical protein